MNEDLKKCPRCGFTQHQHWAKELYTWHDEFACQLQFFVTKEKCQGMESIRSIMQTHMQGWRGLDIAHEFELLDGVVQNRRFIRSEHWMAQPSLIDIYVDPWVIPAIKSYTESKGYAGLRLSDFLKKVANERYHPQ